MKSNVTPKLMDEKWCNPLLNGWKLISKAPSGWCMHGKGGPNRLHPTNMCLHTCLCPQHFAPSIGLGQNWWPTVLEIGFRVHAANGKAQHDGPSFFFGGEMGGKFFGFFFIVPNVFPTCSHHVPMGFLEFSSCSLKTFPIAPQFLSHMICPKFNSHIHKLKKGRL